MNEDLLRNFKEDEVWRALKQMHPTKFLGPNGMSPIFYQRYWDVVGPYVVECVLQILRTSIMLNRLNDTYICLIPKVKCPQTIIEFWPISLCNVIYKIVSKVLANRLKGVLPKLLAMAKAHLFQGDRSQTMSLWYLK